MQRHEDRSSLMSRRHSSCRDVSPATQRRPLCGCVIGATADASGTAALVSPMPCRNSIYSSTRFSSLTNVMRFGDRAMKCIERGWLRPTRESA